VVSVIGAGPVGNYLASLLSKKGVNVDVYEEHKKIGEPVACTGILTSYIKDVIKVNEDYVVNKVKETNVYSPDGNCVNFKLKKNYVIDRSLFDSYLADDAESNGVNFHLGYKLTGMKKNWLNFGNKKVKSDVVVGADGPNSFVARSSGLFGKREFVSGHQARVKVKEKVDSELVEFFLGENYIGWLVPEDNKIVRLGVASKNANYYFNKLMKIREGKILKWQSGVIPVYNPNLKTENDGVYLVGDAATQVKATTYGGIIPGMVAAKVLSDAIVDDKSYESGWRRKIGLNLRMHLILRRVMNRFSDKDYDELIRLCSQSKIRSLVNKYDREYPLKLLLLLGIREPRFFKFLIKRKR